MSSPTTENPGLSEPRLLVPDSQAPPGRAHPQTRAPLPHLLGPRRSRTSLGYISTPLIWQGRKRPNRGGRPTRAPPRQAVHITKPAESSEAQTRVRPTSTTQGAAAHTAHVLAYVHMHAAPPASHQPVPDKGTGSTPPDPELPPASRFSGSSQGALPWQRDEEAVDSSSVVAAAPLASLLSSPGISHRKKKPAALQWSASRGNQTLGNWTDPLELLGSELLDDSTDPDLHEFDASFAVDGRSTVDRGAERQPALRRPDPVGVARTPFSDHVEHLGSQRSAPDAQEEPAATISRSHIPTPTVPQTEETTWDALTLQPPPSPLILRVSSLLLIQPTAPVPILQHSACVSSAEETFVVSSSLPQQEVAQTDGRDAALTAPQFLDHKTSNRSAVPLQVHHRSSSSSCSSLPLRSAPPSLSPVPVTLPPSSSPPLRSSNSSPHTCSATSPLPFSLQHADRGVPGVSSVMSPLFSERQADFVDTAASSSLPLSSSFFSFEAPTESRMPVDGVFDPEWHAVSAEALSSQMMFLKAPPPCGARSAASDEVMLNSFSPTEPASSGPSVESLPFSTEVLAPHLSPHVEPSLSQVELCGPESGLSGVLWPSSVSPFLALSDALPDRFPPPDFALAATVSRVIERTPTLPREPAGSRHPPNLPLPIFTGSLPVATVIPEQMGGEASLLSPHPVVQTQRPSSGSHDGRLSSLTFNRDLSGLQLTVSRLHADSQVNRSSASSGGGALHGPNAVLTPSVMAATQMLGLSSTKPPQRAPGLDHTAYPLGLTPTDSEHLGHVTHTHSSAHTQTHTHSGTRTLSSQALNVSPRSGPDAEAGTRRPQLLPEGLSPSRPPAPSLPVTLTPSPPSPHVSLDASPPPFSSFLTPSLSPLLSAQLTLPAASANIDRSGISRPTNTESPRRSATFPVLSVHRLGPVDRAHVSENLSDLVDFAATSRPADASRSSGGAGTVGRQPASFDPARVVPKVHVAVELEASPAVRAPDDVTLDLLPAEPLCPTSQPCYHQTPPHTSGLHMPTPPTGSSAEAPGQGFISGSEELPRPASAAGFKHITTSRDPETTDTTKTGSASLTSAPGPMGPPQGGGTGGGPAAGLHVDHVDADTSVVNVTVSKLPSNSGPEGLDPGGGPSSGASGPKDAPPKAPASSGEHLKKATPRPAPGSPTVGLTARPPLPCQCKQRFHFTCLCGLSSGNSMSRCNTPVDVELYSQSAACTVKNQQSGVCVDKSKDTHTLRRYHGSSR